MQDYLDLVVWQRADRLAHSVYDATERLPADERYGLRSQSRRAAISVPANIVEGAARPTGRDFARHLGIAVGSMSELEYLIRFCRDRELVRREPADTLITECGEVRRMLISLRASILRGA